MTQLDEGRPHQSNRRGKYNEEGTGSVHAVTPIQDPVSLHRSRIFQSNIVPEYKSRIKHTK